MIIDGWMRPWVEMPLPGEMPSVEVEIELPFAILPQ